MANDRRAGAHAGRGASAKSGGIDRLRDALRARDARAAEEEAEGAFATLHWMTAALFLAAGVEAALRAQAQGAPGAPGPRSTRAALASLATALRDPTLLAPLLTAPLAAGAHATRALSDTRRARVGARVLDVVAAAVAVAGVARSAYNALARGRGLPEGMGRSRLADVVPLTLGATAALGLILQREEERERQELDRLRHRASIVERLVPRRRAHLDRIVLHI